ncbi:MAG: dethiobiotin synthase [Mariprofundus sp.]|nr:dethiobiotin synthase [Mariprofundus sp.]
MKRQIFITATDTNAGKTWVTSGAIRSCLEAKISAIAIKPVACGLDEKGQNEDIQILLKAQNLYQADLINRYRFLQPAAPSLAAANQGSVIDPQKLLLWCAAHSNKTCLIEGIGGLMVPLTDHWLVSDWLAAMNECEVWLVVGCRLGAINQALLSMFKLSQMGRTPSRIILNASEPSDEAWLQTTQQAITPFLPANCSLQQLKYGEPFRLNV